MEDKKILKIINWLKEINAFEGEELIIEDNYIFIPPVELIRDKTGKWIPNI